MTGCRLALCGRFELPPPPLPRGFQGLASAGDPGAVGRDQYRQWRRLVGSVIEGTGWFAVRLMCVVPE